MNTLVFVWKQMSMWKAVALLISHHFSFSQWYSLLGKSRWMLDSPQYLLMHKFQFSYLTKTTFTSVWNTDFATGGWVAVKEGTIIIVIIIMSSCLHWVLTSYIVLWFSWSLLVTGNSSLQGRIPPSLLGASLILLYWFGQWDFCRPPLLCPISALEQTPKADLINHSRIIQSLWLEKTIKVIKSNHHAHQTSPSPTTSPCGSWTLPGMGTLLLLCAACSRNSHHSFRDNILLNIQSDPPHEAISPKLSSLLNGSKRFTLIYTELFPRSCFCWLCGSQLHVIILVCWC